MLSAASCQDFSLVQSFRTSHVRSLCCLPGELPVRRLSCGLGGEAAQCFSATEPDTCSHVVTLFFLLMLEI